MMSPGNHYQAAFWQSQGDMAIQVEGGPPDAETKLSQNLILRTSLINFASPLLLLSRVSLLFALAVCRFDSSFFPSSGGSTIPSFRPSLLALCHPKNVVSTSLSRSLCPLIPPFCSPLPPFAASFSDEINGFSFRIGFALRSPNALLSWGPFSHM